MSLLSLLNGPMDSESTPVPTKSTKLCGQPTKKGEPCKLPLATCKWHKPGVLLCTATTKAGERCKMPASHGELCGQHHRDHLTEAGQQPVGLCKAHTKKGDACHNPGKFDGWCGRHRPHVSPEQVAQLEQLVTLLRLPK